VPLSKYASKTLKRKFIQRISLENLIVHWSH